MKKYFSKFELIQKWLDIYPEDFNNEHLDELALGGYKFLGNGLYIKNFDWNFNYEKNNEIETAW